MIDGNHSPGPWRIDVDAIDVDGRGWTTIVNRGGFVAKCGQHDARLIAAAPETKREHGEMLDLLRTFSRAHPHDQPHVHLGKDEAVAEAQCLICKVGKLLARIDARKANP